MRKALLIILFAVTFFTVAGAGQPQIDQTESGADPGLMPGNFLYGLEKFVEDLEVRIAGAVGGPDMKSKALANNAEERLAEANALADRNRSEEASEMVQAYSDTLNRSRSIAAGNNNTDLTEQLDNISRRNTQKLEEVKNKVPEQARAAIQKAIDKSRNPGKTGRPESPGKSGEVNSRGSDTGNVTGTPANNDRMAKSPGKDSIPGNMSNPGSNAPDREVRPERQNDSPVGGANTSVSENIGNDDNIGNPADRPDNSINENERSAGKDTGELSGKSNEIDRPGRP
ncbi:DUF5667 domain-containing protein [Candidatus Nanosalina sp. VS9-1]|uniref:DUF5667 domain-containing protein n=1 Tax=Candidatus Nanosalina sp. VS9-1 TaxID=3388566 RepID=UPI0039DFC841